ncbi:MAG: endonuclease NucS [Deltaproteobacteria bacterium]|jgi:hypothetical protein|nr:endonuclease NucS [Deltaproteobacteria bacterium]MCL5880055.1 endonuclease NucS [Deltaproteobacteria bacterium]MDA8304510.1 endonuclease NucS [Deltaproteobacteria bacterium]
MKRTEDEIRDHLATNLDLIEPGLVLIEKELLLKNDKGAKGFLDIFCRTADGKYLIIEVKRSDAAAREAVQELLKYIVLLRQNILVKNTEIRLMVASTDWNELLVPFSEFVRGSRYDCTGIRLELGSDELTVSTSHVELAPEDKPRRISRRHFIWKYDSEKKAKAAIPLIANYMQVAGLQDFVLIVLAINSEHNLVTRLVYFAQQELTLDRYMELIRTRFSPKIVAEFEEYIGDMSEYDDKVSEAADKVWEDYEDIDSIYSSTCAIDAQIAHPEKAKFWFSPDNSTPVGVFRFGRFNDSNITDDTIIKEIIGDDGASFYHGEVAARVESKAEIAALKATADNLFYFNPIWCSAVHAMCEYAVNTSADSIQMQAFSNDDILQTVAGIVIGYPGYVPYIKFEIQRNEEVEQIFGIIEWDGMEPDFENILKKYFNGDSFQYFMLRHFGEHRALNADLMDEMGLAYALGRMGEDGLIPVRVLPSSIEDVRGPKRQPLESFPSANSMFMASLIQMFLRHEQEFTRLYELVTLMLFEEKLEGLKDVSEDAESNYWIGAVERCDVCKRDMTSVRFMIDSPVGPGGPWGCMCAVCFNQAGGQIGCGSGQLYEKDDIGWRLVGGACAVQDET